MPLQRLARSPSETSSPNPSISYVALREHSSTASLCHATDIASYAQPCTQETLQTQCSDSHPRWPRDWWHVCRNMALRQDQVRQSEGQRRGIELTRHITLRPKKPEAGADASSTGGGAAPASTHSHYSSAATSQAQSAPAQSGDPSSQADQDDSDDQQATPQAQAHKAQAQTDFAGEDLTAWPQ